MNDDAQHNVWRSYSDMMSGLLLLFVLIMAVCLMQAQKNYNDKLAEQATRVQTQEELDKTQQKLNEQESELSQQSMTLTDLQNALESQALTLNQRESELSAAQATLAQQESELEARDAALAQSQQDLTAAQQQVAASQEKLDEQTQLMAAQQAKIDQIVGVKADLIAALNREFQSNQINVDIDSQTGAMTLESSVLFDYNKSELKDEGTAVLESVLPTYCKVLLSSEYSDYVSEIIIDGYTDSTGNYISNLQLSQDRAFAVAEYLLNNDSFLSEDQQKALSEKLTANGRSSSDLIYDENGNEDQEASRRVEIKFRLKDEEMIAELSQIIADSQNAQTQGETAQG